jgi:hemerythrin-like domain-containing protein
MRAATVSRIMSEHDPSQDAPVRSFTNAHAGIVTHLKALGRLPALLEPAAQARRIASETIGFFHGVVLQHHADEERELFPAVLESAAPGRERQLVQQMVDRLCAEHRQLEYAWEQIEPELKAIARGRDTSIDSAAVMALVSAYQAHAGYEEQAFLPLAQTILERNGDHMAALGLALHLRHSLTDLLGPVAFHV